MADGGAITRAMLEAAWDHVRTRSPAPGVDGAGLADFEADLTGQLAQLLADLRRGVYRAQGLRVVWLPKRDGGRRRVVIATVRDRVAQTAAVQWLHPRIEPRLHPSCFAYRVGLGVQDALRAVAAARDLGLRHVLRTDVANFFDAIPHEPLFAALVEAGVEEPWLGWLRQWLNAPCVDAGAAPPPAGRGTPQGLPVSPLLANLYLAGVDAALAEAGHTSIRYADDLAVCCANRSAADRAETLLAARLAALGLALSPAKTCHATFAEGFEFLGTRFEGEAVYPAGPHPYEEEFTPPPRPAPRRAPAQTLPMNLLRTLYLQEQGSRVGCQREQLVVTRGKETLVALPLRHVDQIFVFGRVELSTPAIAACLQRGIPVYFLSSHGRYYGVLCAPGDAGLALRRALYALAEDPKRRLAFARAAVAGKLANSLRLLERFARNHPGADLAKAAQGLRAAQRRAPHAKQLDVLRGIEGAAAVAYWGGFARCVRGPVGFPGRNRRPPTDPVNSLLSFGYALTHYNVHSYLHARGLDPRVGLFHEAGPGHSALASDLLEEFRAPLVDAVVLNLVNSGRVAPEGFHYGEGSPRPCHMSDETRRGFIHALEEKLAAPIRHPDVAHPVDWRRAIDLQVCRLRRYVEGKIDRYTPFTPD